MMTGAVVLAAGRGQRFGRPKQFETIAGYSLVDRVVATAAATCDHVVLVLPTDYEPASGTSIEDLELDAVHSIVRGGGSHGESAWIGLCAVPDEVDVVVLAAASHPLAGPNLFRRTIDAVANGADAAAPTGLIADAVKRHRDGWLVGSLSKSDLVLAQSPCAFDRGGLMEAYSKLRAVDAQLPPEELEMIEQMGGTIALVEGEPTNIHVTTPLELDMARRLVDLVPYAVVPGRNVFG